MNLSLPIQSTCSSSSSVFPFFVCPSRGSAFGPERIYPVIDVEPEWSGRTYSCTIGFLFGFSLVVSSITKREGGDVLADLYIPLPVHRDIAASLLNFIHHMCLVRHVPLSERNQMFEVIRQQLPPDVYPFNVFPNNLPVLDW
jgi:hypothetical protein